MPIQILQLEIFPSFDPRCAFKIAKHPHGYTLTFSQPAQLGIDEPRCEIPIPSKEVNRILALTRQVIQSPTPDNRLILDGVHLKCSLISAGSRSEVEFRCPRTGTPEFAVVDAFFQFAQESIQDEAFTTYFENIEGYFYQRIGLKVFEGNPRRIRLYGALTVNHLESLTDVLLRASNQESLVVDVRNVKGLGMAVYPCFNPLFQVKDLRFWANGLMQFHLSSMGFDPAQIELFGPPLPENSGLQAAFAARKQHEWEGTTIIKRLMRNWFLRYGERKENEIDGSEPFTLFEKLPAEWQEKYRLMLNLRAAELPIYFLRIDANDFIVNTTQRFIHCANGQLDELDYCNFLGPRGFSAMLGKADDGPLNPKLEGQLAKFLLETKDGQLIAWVIPTGEAGYAFWNITRSCRIIGEKYLRA